MKRKTIGVLIDWTVDSYQQLLINGILDFARDRDSACVIFEGGAIDSSNDYESQRTGIFDLAGPDNVDGLVILSGSLSQNCGPEAFTAFCERYVDLPVVSLGLSLPGVPTVALENRAGLRELVVHLIDRHGARRFAFIKGPAGNQDAAERFETFSAVLAERGLPVDPAFVMPGNFMGQSGIEAVRSLAHRGLDNIDAIVAANDGMALGAIEELARFGPAAAGRIAVTGFDDLDLASSSRPALTTVRLPVYELGWSGAELLHKLLDGQTVPPVVSLPTVPVYRESCGCGAHQPAAAVAPESGIPAEPAAGRRELVRLLAESLQRGLPPGDERKFIDECAAVSAKAGMSGVDFASFQTILQTLWSNRAGREGASSREAEDACFHAVMDLGQQAIRNERERIRGFINESRSLQLIRELLVALDTVQQMGILAYRLPEVGIADCYLALYQRDRSRAHILLGFQDGRRVDAQLENRVFPANRLVPDDFLTGPERRVVIVKALKDIGFVVFDAVPQQLRFIAFLSDIVAGALQAALLFRELHEQKNGISQNLENLRKAMVGFIQTMSLTVETRDPYTAGHQNRVSDLARTIAQEMRLTPAQVEGIRMAGLIHDLGKIYIPSEILNRSGRLDEIEYAMIKRHPQVAYDILKNVDFPWPIADIVFEHHERVDGSGYPRGLVGDAIHLEARILAVADVVEAMASHRPYREALGIEKALAEISAHRGTFYDAAVVDACLQVFNVKGFMFSK